MTTRIMPMENVPSKLNGNGSAGSRTILVTGAAGFIGSNFVRYLFRKYPHYKIIAYDALTYAGNVDNFTNEMRESDRFEFIYGNVCNAAQVQEVMSSVDMVVHLAAETHVTRSIYDAAGFFETDVLGTASICNAVARYKARVSRFIHISSSEVYGSCRDGLEMMDESHPLEPCSPYASAKAGADRLVYSYWRTYDIPAVIVRPFNNYGYRQHLEKVIPRFITSVILNEPLSVHGTGFSSRDWVFVMDTCDAIDRVLHAPAEKVVGEVFNVGTGIDTDVLTIAKTILELMGRSEDLIAWVGERPGQVFKHRSDSSKLRAAVGWEPSTSFHDGLQQTIEWFRDNERFWQRQMWLRKIRIETAAGTHWH
ncbi:MAG: dTDP-glucose 4,6-dehydratase [Vulcanimicrobiaceae bacterium]|jgi:dTDP-glucose 4,6-dehydratase